MSLDITGILNAVVSHAAASGYLERVNAHEPKSAPGNGLSAAVWIDRIAPLPAASGLAQTSALLTVNVRIYSNMLAEPQDGIDVNVVAAVDALMTAYSGDFDLGGTVRNVDLLGQFGEGLTAQAGYLNQDNKLFRVMTINLPLVISDAWTQSV